MVIAVTDARPGMRCCFGSGVNDGRAPLTKKTNRHFPACDGDGGRISRRTRPKQRVRFQMSYDIAAIKHSGRHS